MIYIHISTNQHDFNSNQNVYVNRSKIHTVDLCHLQKLPTCITTASSPLAKALRSSLQMKTSSNNEPKMSEDETKKEEGDTTKVPSNTPVNSVMEDTKSATVASENAVEPDSGNDGASNVEELEEFVEEDDASAAPELMEKEGTLRLERHTSENPYVPLEVTPSALPTSEATLREAPETYSANSGGILRSSLSIMETSLGKESGAGASENATTNTKKSTDASEPTEPSKEEVVLKDAIEDVSTSAAPVPVNPFGFGRRSAFPSEDKELKKDAPVSQQPIQEPTSSLVFPEPIFSFCQKPDVEKRTTPLFGSPPATFSNVNFAIAKASTKVLSEHPPKDTTGGEDGESSRKTVPTPFAAPSKTVLGFGSTSSDTLREAETKPYLNSNISETDKASIFGTPSPFGTSVFPPSSTAVASSAAATFSGAFGHSSKQSPFAGAFASTSANTFGQQSQPTFFGASAPLPTSAVLGKTAPFGTSSTNPFVTSPAQTMNDKVESDTKKREDETKEQAEGNMAKSEKSGFSIFGSAGQSTVSVVPMDIQNSSVFSGAQQSALPSSGGAATRKSNESGAVEVSEKPDPEVNVPNLQIGDFATTSQSLKDGGASAFAVSGSSGADMQEAPRPQPFFGIGSGSVAMGQSLTSPKPTAETKPVSTPLFGVAQIPAKTGPVKFSKRPSFQSSLSPSPSAFSPGSPSQKNPSDSTGKPKESVEQEQDREKKTDMKQSPMEFGASSLPANTVQAGKSSSGRVDVTKGSSAADSTPSKQSSVGEAIKESALKKDSMDMVAKLWSHEFEGVGVLALRPALSEGKRSTVTKQDGVYKLELFKDSSGVFLSVVRTDVEPEDEYLLLEVKSDLLRAGRIKNRPDRLAVTRLGRAVPKEPSEADPPKFYAVFHSKEECARLLNVFGIVVNGGDPRAPSLDPLSADTKKPGESVPNKLEEVRKKPLGDNPSASGVAKESIHEKLKRARENLAKGKPLSFGNTKACPPTEEKGTTILATMPAVKAGSSESGSVSKTKPVNLAGAKRQALVAFEEAKNKKQKVSDGNPKSTKSEQPKGADVKMSDNARKVDSGKKVEMLGGSKQLHVSTNNAQGIGKLLEDMTAKYEEARKKAESYAKEAKGIQKKLEKRVSESQRLLDSTKKDNGQLRNKNTGLAKKCEVLRNDAKSKEKGFGETMKELERLNAMLDGAICDESRRIDKNDPAFRECRPMSSEDYFKRLWTFKPSSWMAFAEKGTIDPVECALYGWYNSGAQELKSSDGATVTLNTEAYLQTWRQDLEVARVRSLITGKGHLLLSQWKGSPCPKEFRTLTARLRDAAELLDCVEQIRKAGLDIVVSLEKKHQIGVSSAHSIVAFNWRMQENICGISELLCDWCHRGCLVDDSQFSVQSSHYPHCPYRENGAVAANLSTISRHTK